jgi:hypothetical protein
LGYGSSGRKCNKAENERITVIFRKEEIEHLFGYCSLENQGTLVKSLLSQENPPELPEQVVSYCLFFFMGQPYLNLCLEQYLPHRRPSQYTSYHTK